MLSWKCFPSDHQVLKKVNILDLLQATVFFHSVRNPIQHKRSRRQLNAQLIFFAETGDDYFSRENGGQNQNRDKFRNLSGPTFGTRIKHKSISVNFVLKIILLSWLNCLISIQ